MMWLRICCCFSIFVPNLAQGQGQSPIPREEQEHAPSLVRPIESCDFKIYPHRPSDSIKLGHAGEKSSRSIQAGRASKGQGFDFEQRISFAHASQVQVHWHPALPEQFYADVEAAVRIWNKAIGREFLVVDSTPIQNSIFEFLEMALRVSAPSYNVNNQLTFNPTSLNQFSPLAAPLHLPAPSITQLQQLSPRATPLHSLSSRSTQLFQQTKNKILIFAVDSQIQALGLHNFLAHTRYMHNKSKIKRSFIYFNFKEFVFKPHRRPSQVLAQASQVSQISQASQPQRRASQMLAQASHTLQAANLNTHPSRTQASKSRAEAQRSQKTSSPQPRALRSGGGSFLGRANFLSVLLHEMGHALGLQHNTHNKASILYQNRKGGFKAKKKPRLSPYDVRNIQCEYAL